MDSVAKIAALEEEIVRLRALLKHGQHDDEEATIKELMNPVNRKGAGPYLGRVNHIALIVSNVGRSAEFYHQVLGLPQIKRPNFDRHGAWLTFGNIELHLIKGTPVVHDGSNLIVGHLSIDTTEIQKVREKLDDLKIPYEQNVSVPSTEQKETDSRVVETDSNKMAMGAVTQFFFRDPDGYYIELCNCDVLTKFCFSKNDFTMTYVEGVMNPIKTLVHGVAALMQWTQRSKGSGEDDVDLRKIFDIFDDDGSGTFSIEEASKILKEFGQTDIGQLEKLMAEVDRDRDGRSGLDFEEFKSLFQRKTTAGELREAFKLFDMDCSGKLSAAELRHVMTGVGQNLTDEEIDQMMNLADRDGDGQVDVAEFVEIFSGGCTVKEKAELVRVDPVIFENLKRRRGVYGDIVQSVGSDEELEGLLKKYSNDVPRLIGHLESEYMDNRTFVPPAYLKADGSRFVPMGIKHDTK